MVCKEFLQGKNNVTVFCTLVDDLVACGKHSNIIFSLQTFLSTSLRLYTLVDDLIACGNPLLKNLALIACSKDLLRVVNTVSFCKELRFLM